MGIARQFVRSDKPAQAATATKPVRPPEPPPIKRGRGRPSSGKVVTTLRLSPDVLAKLKASGPGWQARADDLLRRALGL